MPQSGFHGKIKVVNVENIDIDDMYVQYYIDDNTADGTSGEVAGLSVAPGINFELDPKTLPHKLVRNVYGHFELQPITWEDRRVGDETTNPDPAFVGRNTNGMFFYRNRLCFLTGSNVQMSRATSSMTFLLSQL